MMRRILSWLSNMVKESDEPVDTPTHWPDRKEQSETSSGFAVRPEDSPQIVQVKNSWQKLIRLIRENPNLENPAEAIPLLSAELEKLRKLDGLPGTIESTTNGDHNQEPEATKGPVGLAGQHDLCGLWSRIDDGSFTAESGARMRIIHLSAKNNCVLCDFQIREEEDFYVVTAVHDFKTSKYVAGLFLELVPEIGAPTYEITIGHDTTRLAWLFEFEDGDVLMTSSVDELSAHTTLLEGYFQVTYFRSQSPKSALLPLANFFLSTEDYHTVIDLANEVLESDLTSWGAYYIRATANDFLERFDAAISDFNVALNILSGDETYTEELGADIRSMKALSICNRGLASKNVGDLKRAIADYGRAIAEDPTLSVAYMRRAWLRATSWNESFRDAEAAVADAQKAIELESERNAVFVYVLAAAKASNGEFTSAVELQKDAIRLDSEDAELTEMLQCFESKQPWIEVAPE